MDGRIDMLSGSLEELWHGSPVITFDLQEQETKLGGVALVVLWWRAGLFRGQQHC